MNLDVDKSLILDCSAEVSTIQFGNPGKLRWLASDIVESDWLIQLTERGEKEVDSLAGYIQDNPVQDLQRSVSEFSMPELGQLMKQAKTKIMDGVGFAVLDRLPMNNWSIDLLREVYWVLGQLIGRPVAQKWNGQMIYSVTDTGQEYQYGVRGSHTAVELVFHNDNAFARAVPDFVGLFCVNPAKSGGISRFCSLYTVHDALSSQFPGALKRLYQPVLFDRQKEHAEGAAPVCLAPFFSWKSGRLNARANTSLVRKGFAVAGVAMDAETSDALDAVDAVCDSADIWYEAPLQRGQIQYLNNHEIGHYRSEFKDFDEPDKKRLLYRLWHRESGSVAYDGVAL